MICPFCLKSHTKLLPAGIEHEIFQKYRIVGGGARLCQCPTCGSTDRDRLIYIYLVNCFRIYDTQIRVLHIAPERHVYRKLKQHLKEYVIADLNVGLYDDMPGIIAVDLLDTKFADNSFDLVICNHVLEHVANDSFALQEIWRILAPGGEAVLQVPIAINLESTIEDKNIVEPEDRLNNFGQHDHVRLYGLDYEDRLVANGFSVSKYNLFSDYEEYAINPDEYIYVARKS